MISAPVLRCTRAAAAVLVAATGMSSPTATTRAQAPVSGEPLAVSFLAIGRDGRPILDLKGDEVELRINGRPRTIKSLQRVDAGAGSPGEAAPPPLPPPYGTNASTGGASRGGRTIFFLIEDSSFRPGNERLAKQAIEQFLNTLAPSDRVALITLPLPTVRTDPTTAAEVRQALARVNGVAPPNPTEDEQSARTRQTLEGLRSLFSSLAANDLPSTVIFFSSGMSATTRVLGKLGTSSGDLSTEHFQNVGAAAAAARAHVFVTQANLSVTQRSDGLDNLAGVVGSQVTVLAAAGDNPLQRIAIETSSSYLASFDPEPSERNGQNYRLEVKVTRPDVTTRAPASLAIPRADARTARKATTPRDMLREATVYRDLPLRVAGFTSRDAGEKLKLVVVGEPLEPTVKLTAAVVGVYDAKGKLIAQSTAQPETLAAMPLMMAVVTPSGTYRIRFAAIDANGRGGTADYEMPVELVPAGALKMSTILLGSNDGGFRPLLEFRNEPVAFATLEFYGKPPATLALRMELASSLDGPTLQQAKASGSATKDPDRFIVSGTFDIASLAPGDYLVRAIVGTPESGTGRVVRTLRKVK
ncbi:MAG TPA: hypothetical protein VFJ02_07825 [Vicinamibacterales bacterium]|nr:hypothetical protein [Vicinamibacterales bacterium]